MIMIETKNLGKEFQNNEAKKIIFSGFNLTINKNDVVGLFGQNGSGKTTLLNILSGVDSHFQGKVKLDSPRIAYVNQDPNATLLPWFSCEKNVLLARELNKLNVNDGKVLLKKLCEEFNINFSLQQYPFSLSGGQKQAVALLRALIVEPDVLFLDEPFSALDVARKEMTVKILSHHFSKGMTVVIACHRGDEIKTLITRAVALDSSPAKVSRDVAIKDFQTRQQFEEAISGIKFNENEL